MFKRYLVPMGRTDDASRIAEWVVSFSNVAETEVLLLTVVDPSRLPRAETLLSKQRGVRRSVTVGPDLNAGPVAAGRLGPHESRRRSGQVPEGLNDGQIAEWAEEHAKHFLDEQAQTLRDRDIHVEVRVAVGRAAPQIVDVARRWKADVVMMSASRRSHSLAEGILGSVTDRVLRLNRLPTLVLPAGADLAMWGPQRRPRTIIVPLDRSDLSEAAVPVGRQVARAFGADLLFLHATGSVNLEFLQTLQPATVQAAAQEAETTAKERGSEYLTPFVESARRSKVRARSQIYTGSAARRIVNLVRDNPASLVVMTAHGRSGFRHMILGSVTDKVIRTINQPVVVVPSGYSEA